ncbi:MAG: SPBc2 prophage-derived glycosyltransferase SunS [Verrucomicrobia bacterium ADurb.Bin345]|nr:MAG: SPBc2 prophage-derived glycosyltransferase SunS [Verrucomicrobia bacterium ADurb.Bin345]
MIREKISACVISHNEELKIRRCLGSLTWCDEIVVVDSFSTDRTVDICREFTDRVYQHEWLGYVGQRNLVREMSSHPWILFLDSDEEVSEGLRDEILAEFERGTGDCIGYEFPRQVYYLGRWIRHGEWYPDIKLRLFKKTFGRTEGQEPHDKVVVSGPVRRLKNPIYHYTYDDIRDHVDTLNRFSTITAQQKFVEEMPFCWRDVFFRPVFRFIKGYILRGGFLDGSHGFMIALISSFGAQLKYMKLWELVLRQRGSFKDLPDDYPPRRR